MKSCTFFGHSDTPEEIKPLLRMVLTDLIEHHQVASFYVGNHGRFDTIVRKTLKELTAHYPHIHYSVVLAYFPVKKRENDPYDYSDTIFPDGLENVPPRFAISARNKWMIEQSDYVVTYAFHVAGGAITFKEMALKKGKNVIELSDNFR